MNQCLFRQTAQGEVLQASGSGIDRGQPIIHRQRIRTDPPAFGVNHFQAGVALPHFTEAAQPRPRSAEQLFLGGAEVKEAQGQHAGSVSQVAEQEPPAARRHFAPDHFRLDLRLVTGLQLVERHEAGAILVAQRQMQQHILDGGDAQPL